MRKNKNKCWFEEGWGLKMKWRFGYFLFMSLVLNGVIQWDATAQIDEFIKKLPRSNLRHQIILEYYRDHKDLPFKDFKKLYSAFYTDIQFVQNRNQFIDHFLEDHLKNLSLDEALQLFKLYSLKSPHPAIINYYRVQENLSFEDFKKLHSAFYSASKYDQIRDWFLNEFLRDHLKTLSLDNALSLFKLYSSQTSPRLAIFKYYKAQANISFEDFKQLYAAYHTAPEVDDDRDRFVSEFLKDHRNTLTAQEFNKGLDLLENSNLKNQFVLEKLLKTYGESLPKDLVVYRWGDRQFELARTEEVIGKGNPSFSLATVNGNRLPSAGLGLYAAYDPVISVRYSENKDAALVEVKIPAGTLVVDLVDNQTLIDVLRDTGFTKEDVYGSNLPIAIRYPWGFLGKIKVSAWVIKDPSVRIRHFSGDSLTVSELKKYSEMISGENFEGIADYFESRYQEGLKKRVFVPGRTEDRNVPITQFIPLDQWNNDRKLKKKVELASEIFSQAGDPSRVRYFWRYDGSCGSYIDKEDKLFLIRNDEDSAKCENFFPTHYVWNSDGNCVRSVMNVPKNHLPIQVETVPPSFCSSSLECLPSEVEKNLLTIRDPERPHFRYISEKQGFFQDIGACKKSISLFDSSKLLCLPQGQRAKVVSAHSLIESLPVSFHSLQDCHQALENAKGRRLCVNHYGEARVVEYSDPYQQTLLPSSSQGGISFRNLNECYQALGSDEVEAVSEDQKNQLSQRVEEFKAKEFQNKISSETLGKMSPYLKLLLQRDAKVRERYTVGEHTDRVLKQYRSQVGHYDLDRIQKSYPELGNLNTLMLTMIALHDIGKSLGNREDQHYFTVPILIHFLTLWGFNENQVRLAKELVDHDLIGEMIQGKGRRTPHTVYTVIVEKAKQTGLSTQDFFDLQTLFYTSDASSYPSLLQALFIGNESRTYYNFFCSSRGLVLPEKLRIQSLAFDQLETLINQEN